MLEKIPTPLNFPDLLCLDPLGSTFAVFDAA